MKLPAYDYTITDEKYSARMELFKFVTGMYTALIPFSVLGYEKLADFAPNDTAKAKAMDELQVALLWFAVAVVIATAVLAISYHHKYYFAVYLHGHGEKWERLVAENKKPLLRIMIWLEHLAALIEHVVVVLFSAVWYFPALFGLIYLVFSYRTLGGH